MKAPEKIYLRHNHKGDINAGWLIFPLTNNDIEYIRKDAFIEKAEEYIYKQLNEGCIECGDIKRFIEGMKNYMK